LHWPPNLGKELGRMAPRGQRPNSRMLHWLAPSTPGAWSCGILACDHLFCTPVGYGIVIWCKRQRLGTKVICRVIKPWVDLRNSPRAKGLRLWLFGIVLCKRIGGLGPSPDPILRGNTLLKSLNTIFEPCVIRPTMGGLVSRPCQTIPHTWRSRIRL
jgi:hypothetical protein